MRIRNKHRQAEQSREHYLRNTADMKRRARWHSKQQVSRLQNIVATHLESHPCVDCGCDDIDVLEFDHVRGTKTDNVADMVRKSVSVKRLFDEIDKCEVRCANCHRRVTKQRRQTIQHNDHPDEQPSDERMLF